MNTETIAHSVWRAGAVKDGNKVRQQAKQHALLLVANNLAAELGKQDPSFDAQAFMAQCGLAC